MPKPEMVKFTPPLVTYKMLQRNFEYDMEDINVWHALFFLVKIVPVVIFKFVRYTFSAPLGGSFKTGLDVIINIPNLVWKDCVNENIVFYMIKKYQILGFV